MSYLSFQNDKSGRTYINYDTCVWDSKTKKPIKTKILIGKVDNKTGLPVLNKKFFTLTTQKDKIITLLQEKFPSFSLNINNPSENAIQQYYSYYNDECSSNKIYTSVNDFFEGTKTFGYIYFIRHIALQLDLINILNSSIGNIWRQIFPLVCNIIYANVPIIDVDDWLNDHYIYNLGNSLKGQRISELLVNGITEAERNLFYKKWYKSIKDKEFIALDTSSISTYSDNVLGDEYCYNENREKLQQINACLLFGEESHLPIYQSIYRGNLKDASTLRATLEGFSTIVGGLDINIVMDKGFYSTKNIVYLKNYNVKFIVSVPLTTKNAISLVENFRQIINDPNNLIETNYTPIRGIFHHCEWINGLNVNAHIYYNHISYLKIEKELYSLLNELKFKYINIDQNIKKDPDFLKYFILNNNYNINHTKHISYNIDSIKKALSLSGWLVIITNTKYNTQQIYSSYQLKDVVKKSFWAYNNSLGLDKLQVHSENSFNNKLFITFLALIVESYIRKIMLKTKLNYKYTFRQLIKEVSKIKCFIDKNGNIVTKHLSNNQKFIFNQFNIPYPNEYYSKNDKCINRD
ncbi:MAG: transposase [Deltaproteobacteria bacterium]|jgi:transposase|nr:transposase [Deltaproteobacteria bacterium]